MPVVSARGDPPPVAAIDLAVGALRDGAVVGLPTDTVYGLAVAISVPGAPDLLFRVKSRPRSVELPVLVASEDQAMALCGAVPTFARLLMERYWPGPLTLVLPRRPGLDVDLGGQGATVGVRWSAHPVPLGICREIGAIATTSANRHHEPPATTAVGVAELLAADDALVLDGGHCGGLPSSVVDCTGGVPRLLREGSLSASVLALPG
jgi:tRNA threonylcarbamoyl adenosine modification protein (Sua5/YciO/YrdC/YwlC family)